MSHRAVSGQQFGEQLQLFMSTDELVEKVKKGDTDLRKASPREQWEGVGSGSIYDPEDSELTLKAKKTRDLMKGGSHHDKFAGKPLGTMPPVTVSHGRLGKDAPTLSEGHHRLAWAQMHGMSHIAVEHSMPSESWVEMKNIMSDEKKRPKPPSDKYPPIKVYKTTASDRVVTDYLIR